MPSEVNCASAATPTTSSVMSPPCMSSLSSVRPIGSPSPQKLRAAVSLTMTGRVPVWRRAFALSASVKLRPRTIANLEQREIAWRHLRRTRRTRACCLLSPGRRTAPPIIDSPNGVCAAKATASTPGNAATWSIKRWFTTVAGPKSVPKRQERDVAVRETGVDRIRGVQPAQQEPGRDHQDHAQCDLHADERSPQPSAAAAAAGARGLLLDDTVQIRLGHVQGRQQSEQEARCRASGSARRAARERPG